MNEKTVVVVFPSVYTLNKINDLQASISSILKIKNYSVSNIRKEDSLIIIETSDPVLVSSTISSLFGIEKVAIAKEIANNFDIVLSTIISTSQNLLLKGEKFLVKVEGNTESYLGKDVEIAAIASLVEKVSSLEAKPGSESEYDKLVYTIITKTHAYVCIFIDKGLGGLPYNSQKEKILCCIHDELSAITCLQAIKMGFEVRVIVCYHNDADLLKLVKILNKIIPRIIENKIKIQFCKIAKSNMISTIVLVTNILITIAKKEKIARIALSASPMIFPHNFSEYIAKLANQKKIIPWFPLSGIDSSIIENAKDIGLEKYTSNLKELCSMKLDQKIPKLKIESVRKALKTLKFVEITIGTKNIHDILDSLKSNH
jgi:adenylyl- and sulfurtransferase ThiI